MKLGGYRVGSSQGWVAHKATATRAIYLTDLHKPSVSSPTLISLPSLTFNPSPYTNALALSSSSPNQDQDLTVAAKFYGTHLTICKPFCDSQWTHFLIPIPLLPISDLMYSKTDKAFYFTSLKGLYIGSLHLGNTEYDNKLKFQEVCLRNLPKIPEIAWEMLERCFTSKHLVESPSGELFLVKWYTECIHKEEIDRRVEGFETKTKRFMVFKEKERSKDFYYTEDIGDLCIFLGNSEPFCLSASMYPGLYPNSIYHIGHGLGSYDLATGLIRSFQFDRRDSRVTLREHPYWMPPLI